MSRIVQYLFKIQPGEGRRVILFSLLGAMLTGGLAVGMSAVDALFLSEAGPQLLPVIYLLTPVVMLLYIPVFSFVLARVGIDRVFDMTLALLAAGGLALYYVFASETIPITLPVLIAAKLYANLWLYALYTLYWNFTDSYFDILDAKRLFSFFSAGSAFGAMLGGTLVAVLISYVDVNVLFLVWTAIAVLTAPLLVYTRSQSQKMDLDDTVDDVAPGFFEQMRQLARTIRTSRFVLMLGLVMFGTLVITLLCEYQYMSIFSAWASERGQEAAAASENGLSAESYAARELASLFGRLGALANGLNLLINLFLFNRLIAWLGVRNMALIQPVTYVGTFTLLLLAYDFPAAIAGFFAYQSIMYAIDQNNQNFLFNALPTEGKKQMRTFIECICEPMAVALAGGFLILYGKDVGATQILEFLTRYLNEEQASRVMDTLGLGQMSATGISTIGLAGAVVVLLLTLILRGDYVRAMVINLKKGWLDFSRPVGEVLGQRVASDRMFLLEEAHVSEGETALAAMRILKDFDASAALRALLSFWQRATDEERQHAQPLLEELLRNEDVDQVRMVMEWLENEQIQPDPALIEELGSRSLMQAENLLPLLESPSPTLRGAASVALWSSWNIDHGLDSFNAIRALLRGSEAERCMAVRALGRTGRERYAHSLVSFLNDPSPRVRHEALRAIYTLVNRDSMRLTTRILDVVRNESGAMRVLAMDVLERIGDSSSILPLLGAARSFSPYERRKAGEVIEHVGLQSIPSLVSALQDARYPYKARSIAARALARLSFAQFEALEAGLVDAELRRAYGYVVKQAALRDVSQRSHGLNVLLRFYQDMQDVAVEFVLEVMTVSGRLPSYELLSASLRSPNPKERANAVETIEQGCPPEVFRALLPLIAGRDAADRLRAARARFALKPPALDALIKDALQSAAPLECAAALQSMVESDRNARHATSLLREKLLEAEDPHMRRWLLQMLDRQAGLARWTDMEKLHALSHTAFFATFGVDELAMIMEDMAEQTFEPGQTIYETGASASDLYLIMDGEVTVEAQGAAVSMVTGDLFGENAVWSPDRREDRARAASRCVLLVIPREAALDAARNQPRIAMGLLAKKWV